MHFIVKRNEIRLGLEYDDFILCFYFHLFVMYYKSEVTSSFREYVPQNLVIFLVECKKTHAK